MNNTGSITLEDFSFETTLRLYDKNHFDILSLEVQLKSIFAELVKPPPFLKCIEWFINVLAKPTITSVNWLYYIIMKILKFFSINSLNLGLTLFDDYALDFSLNEPILSGVSDSTVVYSLFEVYSERAGRVDVSPPVSLNTLPINKENSFEIAFNNYLPSTLFTSLATNKELRIQLTDKLVNNATGILHLRANDFAYFFRGLGEYGEKNLIVNVNFNKDMNVTIGEDNHVNASGNADLEFLIEETGEKVLTMNASSRIAFALHLKKKVASAELKEIHINSISLGLCPEPTPDIDIIKNEFNAFFKVVINAISNYILNQTLDVEKLINDGIPLFNTTINDLNLELITGIVKMNGIITVKVSSNSF